MSIDTYKGIDTAKGLKKKQFGLEQFFVDLKFNTKRARYIYSSGIIAGLLIDKLMIARPIIESGDKINEDIAKKMFEQIVPLAKSLVEDYNWKMLDLNNLAYQFFGEED